MIINIASHLHRYAFTLHFIILYISISVCLVCHVFCRFNLFILCHVAVWQLILKSYMFSFWFDLHGPSGNSVNGESTITCLTVCSEAPRTQFGSEDWCQSTRMKDNALNGSKGIQGRIQEEPVTSDEENSRSAKDYSARHSESERFVELTNLPV